MTLVTMPVWIDSHGRPRGSFELFVCASCGLAEWWAREPAVLAKADMQPETVGGIDDVGVFAGTISCPHCQATEHWAIAMLDQLTGAKPVPMRLVAGSANRRDRLCAFVCKRCGLTRWRARDFVNVASRAVVGHATCRACLVAGACVFHAQDATVVHGAEDGGREPSFWFRAVTAYQGIWAIHTRGWFDLRACPNCFHVDWLAQGLDQLEEHPKHGITRVR
jgi:hypothetical protein